MNLNQGRVISRTVETEKKTQVTNANIILKEKQQI